MKKAFLALVFIAFAFLSHAQNNVGIGTTTPNPEAILELFSTDQGLLLPRLNAVDTATNFSGATEGMMFYAQDINRLMYFDGTKWQATSFGDPNSWANNGANIYNINTGGVGIGINIPSAKFHVNQIINGAGAQQYISNTSNATNSSSGLAFTNSVPAQGYMIGIDNTSGIFKISNSTANINAFNRLQIDPLGNVGIGNFAGVLSRLDVDGQITMRTGATIGYVPVSNANGTMTWTSPNTIGPWTKTGTDVYQTVLTDNVGIGETNPSSKLHINSGAAATTMRLDNTVAGNTIFDVYNNGTLGTRYQTTSTQTNIISQSTRHINLFTNGNNRMTIDGSNGYVGISNSNPLADLHISPTDGGNGDLAISTTGTTDYWNMAMTGGNNRFVLAYNNGGFNDYLIVSNTGNMGIGTLFPVNRLDVEGGAAIGATFAGTNIAPTNGLIVQGSVGIGTASPTYKTQIYDASDPSLLLTSATTAGFSNAVNSGSLFMMENVGVVGSNALGGSISYDGSANVLQLKTYDGATTNDAISILRSNGNVGIGILAPNTKLEIHDATTSVTPSLEVENSGGGDAAIRFVGTTESFTAGVDNSAGIFRISDNSVLGTNNFLSIDPTPSFAPAITFDLGADLGTEGVLVSSDDPFLTALSIANTTTTGGSGNKYAMIVGGTSPPTGVGPDDFALVSGIGNYATFVIDNLDPTGTPTWNTIIRTNSTNYILELEKENSGGSALVRFSRNGTFTGSITEFGGTVSYNAFTGTHFAWTDQALKRGELVSMTGENLKSNSGEEGEPVYGVVLSQIENDPRILGSYLSDLDGEEITSKDVKQIMAVGNGDLWVADDGEDLKVGDYLISSITKGHAIKDNKQHPVSYIFAKVAEPVNWSEVSETIDGKKHKKISVLFETFTINHEAEALKVEVNNLKTKTSEMEVKLQKVIDLMGTEVSNK